MKVTCEKSLLSGAATLAGRVAGAKSSVSALEGILIVAEEESLTLTGYNLETGIKTKVDATVYEGGKALIPARMLSDMLRKMPDDLIHIESEGDLVTFEAGDTHFRIQCMNADQYPDLPSIGDGEAIFVPQYSMKAMISQTAFCVAIESTRPTAMGALFEAEGKTLTIVALDGYRVAVRREEMTEEIKKPVHFIVPGPALIEAGRMMSDSMDQVTVSAGKSHIQFQAGDTTLIARRIEGEFLQWRKAIPAGGKVTVKASCADLLTSIDRVSLVTSDKYKVPMRCKFGNGVVQFSANSAAGTVRDICPIEGDGQDMEIGFNNRYMLDAIKNCPADKVSLNLSGAAAPCTITPEDGSDSFLYVVLPVRLRNDG